MNSSNLSVRRPPLESPAQLAVIGLILWLAGALIHPIAILAPLGLALLLFAGIAYLIRPRSQTMYWRGRRIDLNDRPGRLEPLYRALFRR